MNFLGLLLVVALVHFTAIYLFTKGFLLTRLSLSDISTCAHGPCTLTPTHARAVVLIVDALRFDFLSPHPPTPISPYHHNVLTLPRELTALHPQHSFLFNAYADPPTTTLQRIKALTTGSLPTFVDMGSNFGASSIAEDSLIKQILLAGKKAAFMGDDTWLSVFPDSFGNMSFPYDSFNVEDLHTVDNGVIKHLFPLLADKSKPFDLLIGHFLGVDHVGHRVGPDHPSMREKLEQMNDVLTRVIKMLDDDTLLVVLGDHGMDRAGDHGGDGILETSSALWIYSKGPALASPRVSIPADILPKTTFPGTLIPHRTVQQIDLLPTITSLLGLPIPYNNLGTIIPELFSRPLEKDVTYLDQALALNAFQIQRYLATYRSSLSGGELDSAWESLQDSWSAVANASEGAQKLLTLTSYNRAALSACRTLWAQFDPILMGLGLGLLAISLFASMCAFCGLSEAIAAERAESWLAFKLYTIARAAVIGVLLALPLIKILPNIRPLDWFLFTSAFLSCLPLLSNSLPLPPLRKALSTALLPTLHTLSFLSNSFTFWESRIAPFLFLSSIVPYFLTAFSSPLSRLRTRLLIFLPLLALCVRAISSSAICREEQQPYCHVTFYGNGSQPPLWALYLVLPAALSVPFMISWVLGITKSGGGVAKMLIPFIIPPALAMQTVAWLLEYADIAGSEKDLGLSHGVLRLARTLIARVFMTLIVLGGLVWAYIPITLGIIVITKASSKQATVLGHANAFGAPYLLFWILGLGVVWGTHQLAGQVMLGAFVAGVILLLEVTDSVRDVKALEGAFESGALLNGSSKSKNENSATTTTPITTFSEVIPFALLASVLFFGTGHEATLASIQWKAAFVLVPTVVYPWAPLTVVLNTFGAFLLVGMAAPLVGIWCRAPMPFATNDRKEVGKKNEQYDPALEIKPLAALSGLGMMIYYALLLFGTAVGAAVLRRHLMVWKVFAPRFMLGAAACIAVDIGTLFGVGVGVGRVVAGVGGIIRRIAENMN